MQKYKSNITSTSGAAIRGVPVLVLTEAGENAAIFLDRAGAVPAPNPLTTGANGTFYFYAVNGRYSLRTTVEGTSITDADVVLLMDPEELTVAGPIADAVQAAESAAGRAEAAVAGSGITELVSTAQNAVVDANAALISANAAATSADLALANAVAAKDAADLSASAANTAAANAALAADSASLNYKTAIRAFETYAAANAAVGSLADGSIIEVSQDETRAGARTRYKVQAGALVFVVNLDQLRLDLSTENGALMVGNAVDKRDLANGAAPTMGASMVGFQQGGTGAVPTTVQSKLRETVSVFDFMTAAQIADVQGKTLALDVTTAIQAAINATAGVCPLYLPPGFYRVTGELTLKQGSVLIGANAYPTDWRVAAMALTKIKFDQALTNKSLFVLDQSTVAGTGYVWGVHVSNMTLQGTNVATTNAMFLDGAASSTFENIGIHEFARGVMINNGMMNTFERVNASGCTDTALFISGVGITTSQVFNQCVFRESPYGIVTQSTATGYSINTVFNACLIESVTVCGANIHQSCSVEFNNTYCENAPDDRAIVNGTMFRLHFDGVSVSPFTSFAMFRGGDLAGGNFGLFNGSTIIDVGASKYVEVSGSFLKRATNGIRCDATTPANSVYLFSPQFVSVTNMYVSSTGKLCGVYPSTGLSGSPVALCSAANLIFPATPYLSADPNTLDDYDEGTFTASLTCGGGTVTLGLATMAYTKIGRLVTISGLLQVSSVASPTGELTLTGLPFATPAPYSAYSSFSVIAEGMNAVTAGSVIAKIATSASSISLRLYSNGAAAAMASAMKAGAEIVVSGSYITT